MIFSKKIPVYYVIISMVLGGVLPFVIYRFVFKQDEVKATAAAADANANVDCNYSLIRLSGYEFIKPLVFADQNCESEIYAPLKAQLFNQLQKFKNDGSITEAAIYLRDLKLGSWMQLGETLKFESDGLFSLPLLIAYLRQSETKPGLLEQEIQFNKANGGKDKDNDMLQNGEKYKVKRLLQLMISNNDHDAEELLRTHVDSVVLRRTFTDLGLQPPVSAKLSYVTAVHDYSVFMLALYNAGYLSIQNSEYAMALLSQSRFDQGLKSAIPGDVKVAHVFGRDIEMKPSDLQESAIVYLASNPFLLTVMAKGNDNARLNEVLSSISKTVYEHIKTSSQ